MSSDVAVSRQHVIPLFTLVVLWGMTLTALTAQSDPAKPFALAMLTAPAERLSGSCQLASRSEPVGNRVQGLWLGLSVDANPWIGSDRSTIASIRQNFGVRQSRLPDGPPLSPGETLRFFMKWADGIEEGYAAFYSAPSDASVTAVYALRFVDPADAADLATQRGTFAIGSTIVVISGEQTPCFEAVERHIRSFAR